MGGEPKTAMNIVCFPQSGLEKEILAEILRGGGDKATEAGVAVVGGHSVADDEIKYGMAVTGVIDPRKIIRNVRRRKGRRCRLPNRSVTRYSHYRAQKGAFE